MKDAFYFSHDSNARHDPKITAMRSVYGSEGYGWFWMLVEMMREAEFYKLDMQSKYVFNSYAMQLQCERIAIEQFVHDCINEFDLFKSDDSFFWSESLMKRMEIKDIKSKKARDSANARWNKSEGNANALKDDANASKNDAYKESKGKVIKESKKEYMHLEDMPHVNITQEQFDKLVNMLGSEQKVMNKLVSFASWILTQPDKKRKTASPYLTIMAWYRRDNEKKEEQKPKKASEERQVEWLT